MAAAAAAAQAQAVNNNAIRQTAEKQLETMYKTVECLKDTDFAKFKDQLGRQAYAYEWDAHILNPGLPVPGRLNLKDERDIRNAYMVIMNKCDGHPVENLLKACTQGDAQGAFRTVHNFFHRDTQAGKSAAYKDFYGASMANTDSNIVKWVAMVPDKAEILIAAGGQADAAAQLSIFLDGLLPEFKPIKTILEQTVNLTFADATLRVMDYAQTEGITTLTKGGGKFQKNNTFFNHGLNDKNVPPALGQGSSTAHIFPPGVRGDACRGWPSDDGCKFGDDCHFTHNGIGRLAPPHLRRPPRGKPNQQTRPTRTSGNTNGTTNPSVNTLTDTKPAPKPTFKADGRTPAAAKCNYCNGPHLMRGCPDLQADHAAGKSNVHMVDNTQAVDFVFMTNSQSTARTTPARSYIPTNTTLMCALLLFAYLTTTTCTATPLCPHFDHSYAAGVVLVGMVARFWDTTTMLVDRCSSPVKLFLAIVFVLCSFASLSAASPVGLAPRVCASSYYNHDSMTPTANANYEWCSDTGTNRFVTNDINDYVPGTFVPTNTVVAVGGGNTTSPGYGTVIVKSLTHDCAMQYNKVLLMPECSKKLMPASAFIQKGCSLVFDDYNKVTLRAKDKKPILSGIEIDGLYYYHAITISASENNVSPVFPNINQSESFSARESTYFGLPVGKHISAASDNFARHLLEAHWAYGHIHFDKLRKLLGLKKGDDPECPTCTIAKSRQAAMAKQAAERSTRVNHRMHMDIGFTRDCNYKFQLYIDDYTRESYIDVLDNKADAFSCWVNLKDHLENKHAPWKFAHIHTDAEPLYSSPQWEEHCKETGMSHESSSRYRHEQNGVVERGMQSIGIPFRCMMIQANAPESRIPDALRHANVIRNHSPTKANKGWSPREKAAGMKLPTNKRLLRGPLFCLVFAHVYEQERVKHAPRGVACVYLGYDDVNNAYKVMEWISGQEYYTADVTFHPNTFPYRANPNRTPTWLRQYHDIAPRYQ